MHSTCEINGQPITLCALSALKIASALLWSGTRTSKTVMMAPALSVMVRSAPRDVAPRTRIAVKRTGCSSAKARAASRCGGGGCAGGAGGNEAEQQPSQLQPSALDLVHVSSCS